MKARHGGNVDWAWGDGRGKRCVFRVVMVVAVVVFGIGVFEVGLRVHERWIRGSDELDPGLVVKDRRLGWEVAKDWRGRHEHWDFAVEYATNPYGFRGDFGEGAGSGLRRVAVVGDSFVFGFGVRDEETFVALLNRDRGMKAGGGQGERETHFYNFGVPGFSTDQEWMLVRDRVVDFRPDDVMLVVYLGNDLLDNLLRVPMQVRMAKPRFTLQNGVLEWHSPDQASLKGGNQASLMELVTGKRQGSDGFFGRIVHRFALGRWVSGMLPAEESIAAGFGERFRPAVELFGAILGEMHRFCEENEIGLHVVLLAGRSYVERPESLSAAYQEYFRRVVREEARVRGLPVLDLAEAMRDRYRNGMRGMYFPNDGHLTSRGHEWVAGKIARYFGRARP